MSFTPNLSGKASHFVDQAVRLLAERIAKLESAGADSAQANPLGAVVIVGTHSERGVHPAANYAVGSLYVETDRATYVVREVAGANQWAYQSGRVRCTQTNLPADLGRVDENLLAEVLDYAHTLRWTGTGWTWADGDCQSDYVVLRRGAPAPSIGWKLVDGTGGDGVNPIGAGNPIRYLKADGTLGSVTAFADLAGQYPKFGTWDGAANAAVAPTFTGSSANTSSDSAGTPTGSIGVNSGSAQAIGAGLANAAQNAHSHAFTGVAMAGHSHTLTADGSVDDAGEPANAKFLPYYRL